MVGEAVAHDLRNVLQRKFSSKRALVVPVDGGVEVKEVPEVAVCVHDEVARWKLLALRHCDAQWPCAAVHCHAELACVIEEGCTAGPSTTRR